MRKFFGLLAAVAMLAMAIAGVASAGSNKADGTTVSGTNTTAITLGGVVTCHSSSVSGSLTNNGASGVKVDITSASYTNCTGGTVTSLASSTAPWILETTSTTDHITWQGTVTNVAVDIHAFGVKCRYHGTLHGGDFNESTDRLVLAGSLTSNTGFPCPSTGNVSGTYATTPTDLDINTGAGQNTGT